MAADNEPTDLGANPTRHNPDLDAAFGDMDDAAAKLAEAADRLTDAAGQLGVAGDPIRYNPDLDEAFGVPTPAAKSAAKDVAGGGASQPPLQLRAGGELTRATQLVEGGGVSVQVQEAGAAAGGARHPGPRPGRRPVRPGAARGRPQRRPGGAEPAALGHPHRVDVTDQVGRVKNKGCWVNTRDEIAELINRHDELRLIRRKAGSLA